MKYFEIETTLGKRFFPDFTDKHFNQWNSVGYTSPDKIIGGYYAYLKWLEKIDKRTIKEMEDNNVI